MKALMLAFVVFLSSSCGKSEKEDSGAKSSDKAETSTKAVPEVVALKALHKAQEDYKAKHGTYVSDIKYLIGKTTTLKTFEPETLLDEAHSFAMSIMVEDANAGPPVGDYIGLKPGSNGIYAVDASGVVKLMVAEGSLDTGNYPALKEQFASSNAAK